MRVTLRQLDYFIATGETGSIKLASERVNISRPAISTAIFQLEGELGAQLRIRADEVDLLQMESGEKCRKGGI